MFHYCYVILLFICCVMLLSCCYFLCAILYVISSTFLLPIYLFISVVWKKRVVLQRAAYFLIFYFSYILNINSYWYLIYFISILYSLMLSYLLLIVTTCTVLLCNRQVRCMELQYVLVTLYELPLSCNFLIYVHQPIVCF